MKKIIFLIMALIGFSDGEVLAQDSAPVAVKPFLYGESVDRRIMAIHSPIYPREGDTQAYTIKAVGDVDAHYSNPNDPEKPSENGIGIKRIRIWVKVYQITLNASGNREYNLKYEASKLCEYQKYVTTGKYPKTASCNYSPANLPEDAYVWYQASMRLSSEDGSSDGAVVRDRKIGHTAKLSDAVKNSYNDAYPVYRRGKAAEKFNILFTAATD